MDLQDLQAQARQRHIGKIPKRKRKPKAKRPRKPYVKRVPMAKVIDWGKVREAATGK